MNVSPRPGESVRDFVRRGGRLDEDLTTPEHVLHQPSPGRLGQLLEDLHHRVPVVAAGVVQVIVDNPAQFTLVAAATVVLAKAAFRLVRPSSALEVLALMLVLQVTLPRLAVIAMEKGWITFKIRDASGNLVPLIPGKAEPDAAPKTF